MKGRCVFQDSCPEEPEYRGDIYEEENTEAGRGWKRKTRVCSGLLRRYPRETCGTQSSLGFRESCELKMGDF